MRRGTAEGVRIDPEYVGLLQSVPVVRVRSIAIMMMVLRSDQ